MGYELIDSGNFQKLERVGPHLILRPAPQAVWQPALSEDQWESWDARYERFTGGQGKWHIKNKALNQPWTIEYSGFRFSIRLTEFGHLGIFPEHLNHFRRVMNLLDGVKGSNPRILNLFAYTGAATVACLAHGAQVVHVDASKTSVAWASDNVALNGFEGVRWIVEDVRKFVDREKRRGSTYDGIILDPPSFGRGTKSEVWKIEDDMVKLLHNLFDLLDDKFLFLFLSSHSNGYSPQALKNLLMELGAGCRYEFGEMLISENHKRDLPSGAFALCIGDAR